MDPSVSRSSKRHIFNNPSFQPPSSPLKCSVLPTIAVLGLVPLNSSNLHPSSFFKSSTHTCHFHTHIFSIRAYAEQQEEKRKHKESLQPAAQRLRLASQQQFFLENKRRMGYKDNSKKKDPYVHLPDLPHEPRSSHDSNVNKSKPQAQSKSAYQPSMSRTTSKTMNDPPPYDPSPQAQSKSTYQPSMSRTSTRTFDGPPPYDQVDGKAGSDQGYSKSK